MSIQDVSPGRFVVQKFAADPLGGKPQRWCRRVQGRQAAEQQGGRKPEQLDECRGEVEGHIRCGMDQEVDLG